MIGWVRIDNVGNDKKSLLYLVIETRKLNGFGQGFFWWSFIVGN